MDGDVPTRMRAAQITEFGRTEYKIQEVDVPQVKGHEALIAVKAAGFCHTDAMVANGEFQSMGSRCPITGSHEPVGVVVALGNEAERAGKFKVGQRVGALAMFGPCGECPDCKVRGDYTYCTNLAGMVGINMDGGFADYCRIDTRSACHLPDSMSFEQAAPLMCAGVTIEGAIKRAQQHGLKPGGTVGFVGIGALGHLGIQFAKCKGYKVVGIDARPQPIELAKRLKYPPDLLLQTDQVKAQDALPKIRALDPEKPFQGLDAAILLADPQESIDYAVALLARHGLLVLVSQPAEGIKLQFVDVIFKDIRLVGSLLGTGATLQETVDLCAKHGIESSISQYSLEELDQVVKEANSSTKKGKTVVVL